MSTHFNLGILLFGIGEYESARESFSVAVSLAPNDYQAHLALAHSNRKLGVINETILEYNHVFRLHPNHPVAKRELEEIQPDNAN